MYKGKILTFSGIDCSGKSTQIDLLEKQFINKKWRVKKIWSRGGYTPIFTVLKKILRIVLGSKVIPVGQNSKREKAFNNSLVKHLWFIMSIADLAVLYGVWFRWLKVTGYIVIADRYLYDTEIDFELNFLRDKIAKTIYWKVLKMFTPHPDLSFLLTIPYEESIRRATAKNEPFPETDEKRKLRYDKYCVLQKENKNLITIDCMANELAVNKIILEKLGSE